MNQRESSKVTDILAKARWILPLSLWIVLILFSSEFLQKVEERSLFIYDLFWLKDFLYKPSGILSCCSLFLTQFLHIPWLGALIWALLLAASAELTRIVFKIPVSLSALTYIPAAIFASFNMSLGYIVYLINLPGYFFMPVLGYMWALLTVSVLRKPKNATVSLILFAVWGFAGYYVAGFYSMAGIAAACVDNMFSDHNMKHRTFSLIGTAVTLLLAPIVFIGATTYNLSSGWNIGLPESGYGLPLARMQFSLILAMLFLIIAPMSKYLCRLSSKKAVLIIQCAVIAAVIAVPASLWYRDENFKAELAMIHATDNLEWDKALEVFDKIQDKHEDDPYWEPSRVLVVLKDLALIKTGQEGERAFSYEDGSRQNNNWAVPMSLQIGRILYLHYGIPGMCNRWCGEEYVLFGPNYLTYKTYTMVAMVLEDYTLAEKYLYKLGRTLFYRNWAKEQLRLCNDHSLIAKTAPYDMILPLMCYDDVVCSDTEGSEIFLSKHFNGPSPMNSTPLYDRVALFYAMKSKQTTLILTRFLLYLESNNPSKIDRFYQEAAYLLSVNTHNEILESLPYDERTKSLHKAFVQNASKVGNKKLYEARAAFPESLRHSYYFFYYYVNELLLF